MANTALSLVGFMDEEEAHAYLLKTCRLRPEYRNPQALTATWHAARQQLGTSIARAGFPNIQPIPEDQREHLQRVMAHPRFMNPINGMDVDFALVEIEPLLAFQQHIWLERCDELCRRVSTNPPLEELMRVCLPEQLQPISHEVEIQRSSQAGQVTIVIKDLDIETQSLAVYPANDPSAHVIGFRNRRRLPYVQVVRFNGRCYLRNGFHRVYGLAQRGVQRIPCIFLEGETAGHAGIRPGHTFPQELLESDNPPTVAHFTQERAWRLPMQRFEGFIQMTVEQGIRPC